MADKTSQAQHVTELDFDISKIYAQMSEIEKVLTTEGSKLDDIVKKNWKIGDIVGDDSGIKKSIEEINAKLKEYEAIIKKLQDAEKRREATSNNVYSVNEKTYKLLNTISGINTKEATNEKNKLEVLKDQTDELVKQYQLNGKLSDEQKKQLTTYQQQLKESQNNIVKMNTAGTATNSTTGMSNWDRIKNYATYRGIGLAENAVRSTLTTVKDIEYSIMEITRVMQLSDAQASELKTSLFTLSKDYGRSFEDVEEVALRYAQAGYNMSDTIELTKTSLLALNTAELDVENSTNSTIGIMQQWGYSAKDLQGVMDKLNYTADSNAITTQDLVDGLLNASSVAKVANMSFNDTVGVLTAMKEASGRSGKEVGNAFKSILSYIQRPKSLETFDTMGIEVYKDKVTGELLPMMDILQNMTDKWNSSGDKMIDTLIKSGDAAQMMSEDWAIATGTTEELSQYNEALAQSTNKVNDAETRAQATAAAGVYRKNYYIALMENMEKAITVSKSLDDTTGYSAKENEKHMATLQAKINQLVTSLKELAVQFADAGAMDVAKALMDITTNVLGLTENIGGLRTVLLGLLTTMNLIKAYKATKHVDDIQVAIKGATVSIKGASSATKTFGATLNTALGVIGIVATAISAIVGAVDEYNRKQAEARQKSIDQAQSAQEEYNTYKELVAQYKAIGDKTVYTKDEKAKLVEIQKQLNDLYGAESKGIDVVNGKYSEQIKALKDLNDSELKRLQTKQIAALNATNEDYTTNTNKLISKRSLISGEWTDDKSKAEYLKLEKELERIKGVKIDSDYNDGGGITGYLKLSGDSLQRYQALVEIMDKLTASGKDNTDVYNDLQSVSEHYFKEVEARRTALTALISTDKERGNRTKELAKNEKELAVIDKILGDQYNETKKKQDDLNDANILSDTQYSALTSKISGAESSIKMLNDTMTNVKNNQALNEEQVLNLIQNYGLAESAVKKTADGYMIEVSALEKLRQAKITEAQTSRQAQIDSMQATAQAIANRLGMYQTEIKGIKDLATAKQALADIDRQQASSLGYSSINSAYEYQNKVSAPNEIKSQINEIVKMYESLNFMAKNVYSGKVIDQYKISGLSSTKSTEQSLSDITKAFDRIVSLGLKSTSQQISYYETLLKTMKLTEDNAITVEKKLQDLYKQKFNERLDMLDKEKEAKINAINSVYDKQIDALNKLKEANEDKRNDEDYATQKAKLYEELSYLQQRTGAEARENEKKKIEEIAEFEKEHNRKLEDEKIDKQITNLETQKDKELKAIEDKYNAIKELFTSANLELIGTAGVYAPKLYNQFYEFFTKPFENDINKLKQSVSQLTGIKVPNAPKAIGTATTSTSTTASKTTTASTSSASKIGSGSKVKIKSNATNYGGQSTNVPIDNFYKNKPYTVSYLGYGNTQALIKELYSWVKLSDLVQARTGGKTLADGAMFVHENEFIVRPDLTKWLEKQASNDNSISNSNNKKIEINYNAPLYNVEHQEVADQADIDIMKNDLTRGIMKSVSNKM